MRALVGAPAARAPHPRPGPEPGPPAKAQASQANHNGTPADLIDPEWDGLRAKAQAIDGFDGTDEDVLTYAMFPKVAPGFFTTRPDGPKNLGRDPAELQAERAADSDSKTGPVRGPITYEITINGKKNSVAVKPA